MQVQGGVMGQTHQIRFERSDPKTHVYATGFYGSDRLHC